MKKGHLMKRYLFRAGVSLVMLFQINLNAYDLYCWGSNRNNILGTYTVESQYDHTYKSTLTDVSGITSGNDHVIATKSDGSIWTWGNNYYGQLGDGTNASRETAVSIFPAGSAITMIACTDYSTSILKNDGTVWSWGRNTNGQIGDGTNLHRNAPVMVPSLSGIVQVYASKNTVYALKSNGALYAWGINQYGQIGNGTTTDSNQPVEIFSNGVTKVYCKYNKAYAIKTDGSLWGWGRGYIGNGTTEDCLSPVEVMPANAGVADMDIRESSTRGLCFVVKTDGSLWGWGNPTVSHLLFPNESESSNFTFPVQRFDSSVGCVSVSSNGQSRVFCTTNDGKGIRLRNLEYDVYSPIGRLFAYSVSNPQKNYNAR
jgi:alpha-tubulin suppressor-like RCC1 family protein